MSISNTWYKYKVSTTSNLRIKEDNPRIVSVLFDSTYNYNNMRCSFPAFRSLRSESLLSEQKNLRQK